MPLVLEIVTPTARVYSDTIDAVVIPTIDGESSSSSNPPSAARITCATLSSGFQFAGFTSFVDNPHCARALGTIIIASTSAPGIVNNLQFLILI